VLAEIGDPGHRGRDHLLAVGLGVEVAGLVLVGRRPAVDREQIGRECEEALGRIPPRHVLDVRVEAAVLVDDHDRGTLALVLGRTR